MDVTIEEELQFHDEREIMDAVFTISSAKPGNGVEQIRDNMLETYWQSDGTAPHIVNINFMQKRAVSHVCFYCNYGLDESYTVKKASIRCGTTSHDLYDVAQIELSEPHGWVSVALSDPADKSKPLRTHLIQIRIQSMHQNGRDTHIRQLKILGPRSSPLIMGGIRKDQFVSTEMLSHCEIR